MTTKQWPNVNYNYQELIYIIYVIRYNLCHSEYTDMIDVIDLSYGWRGMNTGEIQSPSRVDKMF